MRAALFFMATGLLTACSEFDPYVAESAESKVYDYSQFENFRTINITNTSENNYVSIFYEYPFDSIEGNVTAKKYLAGGGEFSMTLNVPNHVKQLYVLNNGELSVHPVENLTLGERKTRSLSIDQDELDNVYNYVTANYLITGNYNVTGDDLFKCSDICLERDEAHKGETLTAFHVSLIDLMKNGEKKNFRGNLFAYLYPKDRVHDITLDDCIILAAEGNQNITSFDTHIDNNGNPTTVDEEHIKYLKTVQITMDQLESMGEAVQKGDKSGGYTAKDVYDEFKNAENGPFWPLLYSQHYGNAHIVIEIPSTYEGYNLGFCYLGGQNLRFTTPALNIGYAGSADSNASNHYDKKGYPRGNGNYLDYVLKYFEKENGIFVEKPSYGKFKLDRHVSNGFIWHFSFYGHEYDVLGMDNQYPFNNKAFYDSDYADY